MVTLLCFFEGDVFFANVVKASVNTEQDILFAIETVLFEQKTRNEAQLFKKKSLCETHDYIWTISRPL